MNASSAEGSNRNTPERPGGAVDLGPAAQNSRSPGSKKTSTVARKPDASGHEYMRQQAQKHGTDRAYKHTTPRPRKTSVVPTSFSPEYTRGNVSTPTMPTPGESTVDDSSGGQPWRRAHQQPDGSIVMLREQIQNVQTYVNATSDKDALVDDLRCQVSMLLAEREKLLAARDIRESELLATQQRERERVKTIDKLRAQLANERQCAQQDAELERRTHEGVQLALQQQLNNRTVELERLRQMLTPPSAASAANLGTATTADGTQDGDSISALLKPEELVERTAALADAAAREKQSLDGEVAVLQEELALARTQLLKLADTVTLRNQDCQRLEQELRATQDHSEQSSALADARASQLHEVEASAAELRTEVETQGASIDDQEQELQQLRTELSDAEREATRKLEAAQQELVGVRATRQREILENGQTRAEAAAAATRAAVQMEIEGLEQQLSSAEARYTAAQASWASASQAEEAHKRLSRTRQRDLVYRLCTIVCTHAKISCVQSHLYMHRCSGGSAPRPALTGTAVGAAEGCAGRDQAQRACGGLGRRAERVVGHRCAGSLQARCDRDSTGCSSCCNVPYIQLYSYLYGPDVLDMITTRCAAQGGD